MLPISSWLSPGAYRETGWRIQTGHDFNFHHILLKHPDWYLVCWGVNKRSTGQWNLQKCEAVVSTCRRYDINRVRDRVEINTASWFISSLIILISMLANNSATRLGEYMHMMAYKDGCGYLSLWTAQQYYSLRKFPGNTSPFKLLSSTTNILMKPQCYIFCLAVNILSQ
jgi:hypothetical protein